jgi:hypothetical protein
MESLQKINSQLESLQSLLTKINETSQFGKIDKDAVLAKIREIYETALNIEIVLSQGKEEKVVILEPIVEKTESAVVEDISEVEFEEEMVKDSPIELTEQLPTTKPQKQYEDDLLIRIDDVKPEVPLVEQPKILEQTPIEGLQKVTIPEPQIEIKIEAQPTIQPVINEQAAVIEQPTSIFSKPLEEVKPQPNVIEIQIPKPAVNNGESLASKLSHTKIPNISAGLTFSDRLMFQKQLFKDRSEEFARTISDLDDLETFEEAVAWLQATYSWDFENAIVKKFLEIVQRRY